MAVATITGNLTDFSETKMNDYQPRITFSPSGPAMNGQQMLVTRPIVVTPNSAGGFQVSLAPNENYSPATTYKVRVDWLDSGGNCVFSDHMPWDLVVPTTGGDIGDLLKVPANPASVWISETPPPRPTPGTWWLVPSTGNLYEWS